MNIIFAMLLAIFICIVIYYDRQAHYKWEWVADNVWRQKRSRKSDAVFVYKTLDTNSSGESPLIWMLKDLWGDTEFITQHTKQLQRWWAPLRHEFVALKTMGPGETLKRFGFSPDLGITIQILAPRKTQSPLKELEIIRFLQEAQNTWNPRRFDVDTSYPLRKWINENYMWFAVFPGCISMYGMLSITYLGFFNDYFYVKLGAIVGLTIAFVSMMWLYPKFSKSMFLGKALIQVGLVSFVLTILVVPLTALGLNMVHASESCEIDAPVKGWRYKSGKNRAYYATLWVSECNLAIPTQTEIEVPRFIYENRTTIQVRISKGLLGRYVLIPL